MKKSSTSTKPKRHSRGASKAGEIARTATGSPANSSAPTGKNSEKLSQASHASVSAIHVGGAEEVHSDWKMIQSEEDCDLFFPTPDAVDRSFELQSLF
ncbi:hypothetical protein JR316_0010654 [Psilocybe cubensis]|nr:hypothetical protein JR316_0010536 [Psilocybe cubensis]XP_047744364.1 hypothetical protein JR316_0010654 [Psilocybe cubensis]KAH9476623.1 hypothetical protein JR316_0010536 [Psilocybe cubensis]KAH9476739.1 hypothetical protein JR316_0010654 [Psilocybe cubensis]